MSIDHITISSNEWKEDSLVLNQEQLQKLLEEIANPENIPKIINWLVQLIKQLNKELEWVLDISKLTDTWEINASDWSKREQYWVQYFADKINNQINKLFTDESYASIKLAEDINQLKDDYIWIAFNEKVIKDIELFITNLEKKDQLKTINRWDTFKQLWNLVAYAGRSKKL